MTAVSTLIPVTAPIDEVIEVAELAMPKFWSSTLLPTIAEAEGWKIPKASPAITRPPAMNGIDSRLAPRAKLAIEITSPAMPRITMVRSPMRAAESRAPEADSGILAASGLGWAGALGLLMRVVKPWRGRLILTFLLGISRVAAFISVGLVSALAVAAVKTGDPIFSFIIALIILAPAAGVLHWLESWVAHDMAFRLLAQMRIDLFRKIDSLAPAYLVRRRTGDLVAMATHDVELVEYFFAHTIAPAFVAVLVPGAAIFGLAWVAPSLALALLPFLLVVGVSTSRRCWRPTDPSDRGGTGRRPPAGQGRRTAAA